MARSPTGVTSFVATHPSHRTHLANGHIAVPLSVRTHTQPLHAAGTSGITSARAYRGVLASIFCALTARTGATHVSDIKHTSDIKQNRPAVAERFIVYKARLPWSPSKRITVRGHSHTLSTRFCFALAAPSPRIPVWRVLPVALQAVSKSIRRHPASSKGR